MYRKPPKLQAVSMPQQGGLCNYSGGVGTVWWGAGCAEWVRLNSARNVPEWCTGMGAPGIGAPGWYWNDCTGNGYWEHCTGNDCTGMITGNTGNDCTRNDCTRNDYWDRSAMLGCMERHRCRVCQLRQQECTEQRDAAGMRFSRDAEYAPRRPDHDWDVWRRVPGAPSCDNRM
jgi:hypothetical protein